MDGDEGCGPPEDGRGKTLDPSGPTRWVVSDGATDCDHPPDALSPLGDDGLNGYYRCDRCDAGVVVQEEVGRW